MDTLSPRSAAVRISSSISFWSVGSGAHADMARMPRAPVIGSREMEMLFGMVIFFMVNVILKLDGGKIKMRIPGVGVTRVYWSSGDRRCVR